jgi:hypothetical protein
MTPLNGVRGKGEMQNNSDPYHQMPYIIKVN